jgi:hypothetical protein
MKTQIVTCYKEGTQGMLTLWVSALITHTYDALDEVPHVDVVVVSDQAVKEAQAVVGSNGFSAKFRVIQVVPEEVPISRIHGAMLDAYLAQYRDEVECILTMDSDCFPVADCWLGGLWEMLKDGAKVAGILHPLAPPPDDMDHNRLEWRVRSQHCWNSTHVACQMIRMADLKELGVSYAEGDDTGLLIPLEARKRGWKVDGYRVTRCAKPWGKPGCKPDPEFNRYVRLVFGDKVYHHGGFTRITTGMDKSVPEFETAYGWVFDTAMMHGGAEFLLEDEYSYKFKLDREEEVAADKIDRLFGRKTMG